MRNSSSGTNNHDEGMLLFAVLAAEAELIVLPYTLLNGEQLASRLDLNC